MKFWDKEVPLPYVIGRPPKFLVTAGVVAGLLFAPAAAMATPGNGRNPQSLPRSAPQPASPDASCPTVVSTPVLDRFGDDALYSPVPGGTFNGPRTQWSLSDASVVKNNEPWNVINAPRSRSLELNPGGSATSPSFCLDNGFPSFRFFAATADGGSDSSLSVQVLWADAEGDSGSLPIETLSGGDYPDWTLTPSLALGSALADGQTVSAQLVFTASPTSSWNIDDVLLDPYAK
jgi:hypothetical protein